MIVFSETIGQMCVDSRKKKAKELKKNPIFNINLQNCESASNQM